MNSLCEVEVCCRCHRKGFSLRAKSAEAQIQHEEHSASDVDLMIVGILKKIDFLPALRKPEARFRREVNVTLYSPEEFLQKLAAGDHFLHSVLKSKTIPLKGTLNELEETASRQ